eukprot:1189744-Prorocentrum_minimum.AAC.1
MSRGMPLWRPHHHPEEGLEERLWAGVGAGAVRGGVDAGAPLGKSLPSARFVLGRSGRRPSGEGHRPGIGAQVAEKRCMPERRAGANPRPAGEPCLLRGPGGRSVVGSWCL